MAASLVPRIANAAQLAEAPALAIAVVKATRTAMPRAGRPKSAAA